MIKIVLGTMTENTLQDVSYNTITDQRREENKKPSYICMKSVESCFDMKYWWSLFPFPVPMIDLHG